MITAVAILLLGILGWSLIEARRCVLTRLDVAVQNLPAAFDGFTIAFLADLHYGFGVPLAYLKEVVERTNALKPDLIALGGDYVQRRRSWSFGDTHIAHIRPGIGALAGLRAKNGIYAVLGNHDIRVSREETSAALADNGFREITNAGEWIFRGGERLRICGIDDLRWGRPDLAAALGDAGPGDAAIVIAHNPDSVETMRDPRVKLVLSGHTHGGQVVLPLIGAPIVPSRFGQKYRAGLVQGPAAPVFVTRGIGLVQPPVRFRCPPEIALLTLRRLDGAPPSAKTC